MGRPRIAFEQPHLILKQWIRNLRSKPAKNREEASIRVNLLYDIGDTFVGDGETSVEDDKIEPILRIVDLLPSNASPLDGEFSHLYSTFCGIVTTTNERYIRTYHRTLSRFQEVFIHDGLHKSVWVVKDPVEESLTLQDTHAGHQEIHLCPYYQHPTPLPLPDLFGFVDPMNRCINPQRRLTTRDVNLARRVFPHAKGFQVLISGFFIVLIHGRRDLIKTYMDTFPDVFGGLRVGIVMGKPSSYCQCRVLQMWPRPFKGCMRTILVNWLKIVRHDDYCLAMQNKFWNQIVSPLTKEIGKSSDIRNGRVTVRESSLFRCRLDEEENVWETFSDQEGLWMSESDLGKDGTVECQNVELTPETAHKNGCELLEGEENKNMFEGIMRGLKYSWSSGSKNSAGMSVSLMWQIVGDEGGNIY